MDASVMTGEASVITSRERRALPRETPAVRYVQVPTNEGLRHYRLLDVSGKAFSLDGVLDAPLGKEVPLRNLGTYRSGKIIRKDKQRTVVSLE